ncbi:hypothetical protein TNIN_218681 [Trichonephila inaurata madagascariensis]|uniref:Uncharacterized protein n=1 Tax=Trichonephila inaurata madagascariensis TaxID=2747483 RepID=A0A8X7CH21_9ARAC|nr:hypothetical protein TNIN_218681 [Trichonephila inaurata madagascariensis]
MKAKLKVISFAHSKAVQWRAFAKEQAIDHPGLSPRAAIGPPPSVQRSAEHEASPGPAKRLRTQLRGSSTN